MFLLNELTNLAVSVKLRSVNPADSDCVRGDVVGN